ncbi:MAG: YicC family protein [Puniceicoccales bacterium]|jgi:uncharacterized protein (TIGR00255 family)|nr:YicC family protein [Puniceicoccales bacterium]
MSLKSMTGYGRASFAAAGLLFTVEASSVNRRGLEINVSAPAEWAAMLERLATPWVREYATRGKILLTVFPAPSSQDTTLAWDSAALAGSIRKLGAEAESLGIPFAPDATTLLHLAELLRTRRAALPSPDTEAVRAGIETGVRDALSGLVAMRKNEGASLAADLLARITLMESILDAIQRHSAHTVTRHGELLLARLRQTGLDIDLRDERVLKEIAIFADRCDTTEEITRLGSHFAQFRAIVAEEADVGRKLDFLCQEINRELNTIGSKANALEVTRAVIDGKNELERIREQVQNVE